MGFSVGQTVECINDTPVSEFPGPYSIKKGEKYVIFALCPPGSSGIAGLQIQGHPAPIQSYCSFMGWKVTRFRPVTCAKTFISFTMGAPLDSEHWDGRKGKVRA